MASGAKRKNTFILGFFALIAIGVVVLMNITVPAPVAERSVELDASNVLGR